MNKLLAGWRASGALREYRQLLTTAAKDDKEAFESLAVACGALGLALEEFGEAWDALEIEPEARA